MPSPQQPVGRAAIGAPVMFICLKGRLMEETGRWQRASHRTKGGASFHQCLISDEQQLSSFFPIGISCEHGQEKWFCGGEYLMCEHEGLRLDPRKSHRARCNYDSVHLESQLSYCEMGSRDREKSQVKWKLKVVALHMYTVALSVCLSVSHIHTHTTTTTTTITQQPAIYFLPVLEVTSMKLKPPSLWVLRDSVPHLLDF